MKKFVIVREYIYGWDFSEWDEDGIVVLHDTEQEAKDELTSYAEECNQSFSCGMMDEPYQNDMSVAEVDVTPDGEVHLLPCLGDNAFMFKPFIL